MKFPFKNYPNQKGESDFWPVLQVQISNPAKHSPPSKRFEALIDSGASRCIFHANIGKAIGFDIEKGEPEDTFGISGKPSPIWIHRAGLYVAGSIITVRAGFSYEIPLAAVLGRIGFFDNYKITFDSSVSPPGIEIERIARI